MYWLHGGPQGPRPASVDVVRLAGYMASGEVRGYVVAMLRSDGVAEAKMGGELLAWAPTRLRALAAQVEDMPRIDAEVARLYADRGMEMPTPPGDIDLTESQKDWLAHEARKILRLVGRS